MRYRSGPGVVEVDGLLQWARAATLDCGVIRPGLLVGGLLAGSRRHRSTRRWARRTTRMLGIDLTMSGARIDTSRSHVIVALHEGVFDPVALLHLPLPLRFVLRSEIMELPGVGRYARATGQIAADPEAGRSSYRSLLTGAEAAREAGENLVVFPQGTILGIETAFSGGAFRVAERTEQPVLPVVVTGSHRVWEHPFSPRLRFGASVHLEVLAAVEPDELQARGSEAVRAQLQDEMKRIALSGSVPPPRRFEPSRDGWWDGYAYEIDPAFGDLARRVARHREAARV